MGKNWVCAAAELFEEEGLKRGWMMDLFGAAKKGDPGDLKEHGLNGGLGGAIFDNKTRAKITHDPRRLSGQDIYICRADQPNVRLVNSDVLLQLACDIAAYDSEGLVDPRRFVNSGAATPPPPPGQSSIPLSDHNVLYAAFDPKERGFANGCRTIMGIVAGDPRIAGASLSRAINCLERLPGAHVQADLARWMKRYAESMRRQAPEPALFPWSARRVPTFEGYPKIALREIQLELGSPAPIARLETEDFLSGEIFDRQDRVEIHTVLSYAGLQKNLNSPFYSRVRVDAVRPEINGSSVERDEGGRRVLYPHPAFAPVQTTAEFRNGMAAVANYLSEQSGGEPCAFRWAIVEQQMLNRLVEGGQAAAAARVAAALLSSPRAEEWANISIWVHATYKDDGTGTYIFEESATPLLVYAECKLFEKGKHLVLARCDLQEARDFESLYRSLYRHPVRVAPLRPVMADFNIRETIKQAMSNFDAPTEKTKVPPRFFVGRKSILGKLTDILIEKKSRTVSICASIKGMGGIGKTELALQVADKLAETLGRQSGLPGACRVVSIDLWGHRPADGASAEHRPKASLDALRELWTEKLGLPSSKITDLEQLHKGDPAEIIKGLAALYRDHLEKNATIVILDNAYNTEQLAPLLPLEGTPGASLFLVTSRHDLVDRHPLITEANSVNLPKMSLGEVRDWVRDLASAAGLRGYEEDLSKVTGGLPLAISIVISCWRKAHGMPVKKFFAWIKSEVLHLSDGDPAHLRLAECFRFSTNLLTLDVRAKFHRLCVFPGTFDATAVAAVCGKRETEPRAALSDAHRLLLELAGASLIERDPKEETRFYLHDLMRDYAREELIKTGPEAVTDAEQKFVAHYAGVMAYCGEEFTRGGDACTQSAEKFVEEAGNLEVGMKHALRMLQTASTADTVRQAAVFIAAYAALATRTCDLAQTATVREAWTQQAIDAVQKYLPSHQRLLGRLSVAHGLSLRHLNHVTEALDALARAEKFFQAAKGVPSGQSDVCGNRGNLLIDRAKNVRGKRSLREMSEDDLALYKLAFANSEDSHNQALALSEEISKDDRGKGQDYGNLAIVYAEYGHLALEYPKPKLGEDMKSRQKNAEKWFRKAEDFYRLRNEWAEKVGDLRGLANGLGNLGNLQAARSQYAEAIASQQQARDIQSTAGNKRGLAATLGNLASAFYQRGGDNNLREAEELNLRSIKLFQESGDNDGESRSAENLILIGKRKENPAFAEPPAHHLADRYGKVTDALIAEDFPADFSALIKASLSLIRSSEMMKRH